MSDFKTKYDEMANNSQTLREHCPNVMQHFRELHGEATKEKVLTTKTKELIAVGIAVSTRCEDCILSHVRTAIRVGATMEELAETIEVAILMGGGPSTAYGAKALAAAEYLFSIETIQ